MHYSEMERYWIWLSSIDGIGVKRFYQLLSIFEDPRAVWDNISAPELKFLGAKTVQALRAARTDKYLDSLFTMLESACLLYTSPKPCNTARWTANTGTDHTNSAP